MLIRKPGGFLRVVISLVMVITSSGCATTIPKGVLRLNPESLSQRQLQTKKYETTDEKQVLSACSGVLQDLGFTLDDSETHLGLIMASKDRTAVDTGQVVGATMLVVLGALAGVRSNALEEVDAAQKLRASLVTAPSEDGRVSVRVTFQRIVWNRRGDVSRMETISDPELYQGFFDKLSKSLFLEAHEI